MRGQNDARRLGREEWHLLDGWDSQDGDDIRSVLLGRSTDDGATWSTTLVSDTRGKTGEAAFTDKPVTGLAIDTTSGSNDIVYVGWRREFPNRPSDVPPQPMVAVSADGGKTFGAPQSAVAGVFDSPAGRADLFKAVPAASPSVAGKPVDVATNFGGVNPRIVVGGNGTAYVLWIGRTANIDDRAAARAPRQLHLVVGGCCWD